MKWKLFFYAADVHSAFTGVLLLTTFTVGKMNATFQSQRAYPKKSKLIADFNPK
jgi:hypothetical protein